MDDHQLALVFREEEVAAAVVQLVGVLTTESIDFLSGETQGPEGLIVALENLGEGCIPLEPVDLVLSSARNRHSTKDSFYDPLRLRHPLSLLG